VRARTVTVHREQTNERVAVDHRSARDLVEPGTYARHQPPNVDDALLDEHYRRDEALLEREVGGNVGEGGFERPGIEGRLDDGGDDLVLVGEGPEDRAFGDLGGFRDLAARDPVAELEQERHGGRNDRRPPFFGREGRRAAGLGGRCRSHGPATIAE
jgi:hypothetical protein